jgi:hypothetical protein
MKCQYCQSDFRNMQGVKIHESRHCDKNPKHKDFISDVMKAHTEEYAGRKEIIAEELKSPTIPQIPPTRRDKEIALKETEIAFIKDFAGGRHQNTTISHDERILLAVLNHDIAINPWSISKRICEDRCIPFNTKEFEIDFLKDFIQDYLDFGLPLDRAGRSEVKDIFKAYFQGDQQDEKEKQKLIP